MKLNNSLKENIFQICFYILISLFWAQVAIGEPLTDYDDFDQTISLDSFRAGNHDIKGINDYFFNVLITGYLKTKKEKALEEKKKKKLSIDKGMYWAIKLEALSLWKPQDKDKEKFKIQINGNSVRKLISKMMHTFEVEENQVAIKVSLFLNEENKKYFILDDNKIIGMTEYYIIPINSTKSRQNQSLMIEDSFGVHAKISVVYNDK